MDNQGISRGVGISEGLQNRIDRVSIWYRIHAMYKEDLSVYEIL